MKCKNCHTQNSDHALKCINCNAPLDGSMVIEKSGASKHVQGTITCKNCKTSNPADALKCMSCNAPLDGSMVLQHTARESVGMVMCKNCKNANPASALKCQHCNAPLDGSMVIQPAGDTKKKQEDSKMSTTAFHENKSNAVICSKCAYPNQAIAKTCVKCHSPLTTASADKNAGAQKTQKAVVSSEKDQMNATINPWAEQPEKPIIFNLIPLKSDFSISGEAIALNHTENTLNRENLDPGNVAITSSSQAVISYKEGKWYIKDTSSLKTTFIKVHEEQELQDGDIILMGNKLFKFSREL
ncbi:MAG: FHA domain-containing protein [Chitinophagales bacterium]|nr:FHA domain-containing protein [Chitinophagales bacterium]